MQTTTFNKRIYTLSGFKSGVHGVLTHLDDLQAAAHSKHLDKAFAEKIMLAVTRVNGCRYCSFGHTRAALAAGVSESELKKLMAGEFNAFPESQVVALTFAQHYAESYCQPDPVAMQRLVDYYGPDTSQEILAYLRMITFGNLFGNTFDALLSRVAGKPATGSSFFAELGVILGGLFVVPFSRIFHLLTRLTPRIGKARKILL